MKTRLFELVLQYIPDVVVPGSDSDWDYHQNYTEVPGAITVVQRERNSTFTNEFWADGVRPKGLKVLAEILVKAFGDMRVDPNVVKALTK